MSSLTKTGLLLLNLGTPKSLELADIKSYLSEFLNDPYVIDIPWIFRKLLVNGIILRTRPHKAQEAYKKIWTQRGSPLLTISLEQRDLLAQKVPVPVALGMRYSEPSLMSALRDLKSQGCERVVTLSLYPQYALSSTKTGEEKVLEVARALGIEVVFVPEFYDDPGFIKSTASAIRDQLPGSDALLLSYHGLPERHVKKTDGMGGHYCLSRPDCCAALNDFNRKCYRAQSFATTRALQKELGLPSEKVFTSFQSRLTKKWIQPFTDELIQELPARGIKTLTVACPSFVTDCLETLEEIAIRAREDFIAHGGKELRFVSCLNTRPDWIQTMADMVEPYLLSSNA